MSRKQRSGLLGFILGCTLVVLGNLHEMPVQAASVIVGIGSLLLGAMRFLGEEGV